MEHKYTLVSNEDNYDDIESNFKNANEKTIELVETKNIMINDESKEETIMNNMNNANDANDANDANNESICHICQYDNDNSSKKLDFCNCNIKYHPNCIEEIKNKYRKCPICKTPYSASDTSITPHSASSNFLETSSNFLETSPQLMFLIKVFRQICMSLIVYYICVMIYGITAMIFFNSTLNYCDNKLKMCKYYLTTGTLVSNRIYEKYDNFNIQYLLLSTYNYTLKTFNETNGLNYGTCTDLEAHIYNSYDTALIVKEKSIGETKNIFVSFSNTVDCKLNYEYYAPNKLYFFSTCLISLIYICFIVGIIIYFINKYGGLHLHSIPNNFVNVSLKILLSITVISWILSALILIYYSYFI